ncbi:hypothetical protein QVD17_38728 [Tagetes erecta]|uniref:Uncharacterized protein n=1 Tax=Tagetes erecta TaxID=13708 RepID=A0AAD8NFL5_TARER|nr:hypothetical protein QVD17_38728 [Tagetes erecta]
MVDYKSNSYNYNNQDMQLERYNSQFDSKVLDLRSNSVSYNFLQNKMDIVVVGTNNDWKLKKVKSTNGSGLKSWRFSDPEFQREKKKLHEYKVYTVKVYFSRLQKLKKQTAFYLQTAEVWSTSSSADVYRCGLQIADIFLRKKQTTPDCLREGDIRI